MLHINRSLSMWLFVTFPPRVHIALSIQNHFDLPNRSPILHLSRSCTYHRSHLPTASRTMTKLPINSLSTSLHLIDPTISKLVRSEAQRQRKSLELIASENFTSTAVREAVGSGLCNKYSEGTAITSHARVVHAEKASRARDFDSDPKTCK